MATVIAAAAYFFLASFLFTEIVSVPQRLAIPRVNTGGIFGRRASVTMGGLSALLLSVLGLALWFALCVIPVTLFAARLNAVAPPLLWFFVPLVLGMLLRKLTGRRRAAA
ncbi:hypothetical protein ACFQZQ_13730 [Lysobacter koreensis]|uniref:Uncharacterized protein n=1 Tax=Lysobacter koreensis TaxID=266122 RepID=A0ABW2YPH7_9GAMM